MTATTAPRVGFTVEADDRSGSTWDDVVSYEREQLLAKLTTRKAVTEIEPS